MYGLVNKAVQDLISREHGEEVWEAVATHAGVEDSGFVSMDSYDDRVTYSLVASAAEILQVSAEQLLEAFGEHWIRYTAREGYGELLDVSGEDFESFLNNLDRLHSRVGLSFPEMAPPSFTAEKLAPNCYRLHYRSARAGLAPMVVGLVRGLADKFGLVATIEPEPAREDHAGKRVDTFKIEVAVR